MTIFNDQLSDWTKKLQNTSQSQICTKQRSWSLFDGLLLIDCPFLNPNKTNTSEKYAQQIHKVHQKLQYLQPTWVNRKGPISLQRCPTACCTNNISEIEQIELQSFASYSIFAWPLTNWLPLLKHLDKFLQGKCFHNEQEGENVLQEFIKSQSMDFYATEINKLLGGKSMLIVMVLFWLIKRCLSLLIII